MCCPQPTCKRERLIERASGANYWKHETLWGQALALGPWDGVSEMAASRTRTRHWLERASDTAVPSLLSLEPIRRLRTRTIYKLNLKWKWEQNRLDIIFIPPYQTPRPLGIPRAKARPHYVSLTLCFGSVFLSRPLTHKLGWDLRFIINIINDNRICIDNVSTLFLAISYILNKN